jgi:L-2-hydroxyglutarate oxidase LhgO
LAVTQPDFLIVGAGVVGITLAREIKANFPDASIHLIEKEPAPARHASGRNSGVLHAGFYYSAASLKARFSRAGNEALRQYCEERNLRINKCGKLVIPRSPEEFPQLDELLRRAAANGVELHEVTDAEVRAIEPRAHTCGRALFSPLTASVDPVEVLTALEQDCRDAGIQISYNTRYLSASGRRVRTSAGDFEPGLLVNAAGVYADRLARDFGFSRDYRILPFKGLYLCSEEPVGSLRTNIYPVPDLRNPFLGVHFTVTVDGHAKIGPTAIPAFWCENYSGFDNFSVREMIPIAAREMSLFASAGFDFRGLALAEMRKYSRRRMVDLARALVNDVRLDDYRTWGRPGIRAQLLNIKTRKLEMDFVVEGNQRSLHVLNAVSPAFTCSIPFAQHVCGLINQQCSTRA